MRNKPNSGDGPWGTRGTRAKQTQFAGGKEPGLRDRGRRASRTNKANLPPRRREDHCQEPALSAANGPETSTLPPVTGAMAPNKANSVRGSKEPSAWRERSYGGFAIPVKQSQFPRGARWDEAPGARDAGQSRETNPICQRQGARPGGRDRRASRTNKANLTPRCREDHRREPALSAANGPEALTMPPVTGAMMRNKANPVRGSRESSTCREKSYGVLDTHVKQSRFSAAPSGRRPGASEEGNRAKRTQFCQPGRSRGDEGQSPPRETKPIWRWPAGIRGRIMQNEPNLRGRQQSKWADCAKRSQLGEPGSRQPGINCAKQSQSAGGQDAAYAAVPLIHGPSPAAF
jgi:hypothetical protein